jgi:hypothetical protein
MASQVENDCDSVGEECYYGMLGLFVAKSATWAHYKQYWYICVTLLDGDMLTYVQHGCGQVGDGYDKNGDECL